MSLCEEIKSIAKFFKLSVVDSVLYLERTVLISKKSILIDGFLFGSYELGNP